MKFLISFLILFGIEANAHNNCDSSGKVETTTSSIDDVMCKLVGKGNPAIVESANNASYRLTKESDRKIKIEINPRFEPVPVPGKSYAEHLNNTRILQEKFMTRMNSCLTNVGPYLKGPGGEQLTISAITDSEIPPFGIQIKSMEFQKFENAPGVRGEVSVSIPRRSSMESYDESIDCPTILHEVLHMLGLEDEYPEDSAGFIRDPSTGEYEFVMEGAEIVGYDCRAIGPEYSIMHDQSIALEQVLSLVKMDMKSCTCKESFRACEIHLEKNISQLKEKKCPGGFETQVLSNYETFTPSDYSKFFDVEAPKSEANISNGDTEVRELKNGHTQIMIVETEPLPPSRSSLLMPAHFRMITNPYCYTENKRYKDCTAGAYSNSRIELSCLEKAKQCQSNTDWLL